MKKEQLSVVSGRWSVVSGQWSRRKGTVPFSRNIIPDREPRKSGQSPNSAPTASGLQSPAYSPQSSKWLRRAKVYNPCLRGREPTPDPGAGLPRGQLSVASCQLSVVSCHAEKGDSPIFAASVPRKLGQSPIPESPNF